MTDMSLCLGNGESMFVGAYLKDSKGFNYRKVFIWLENENRLSISIPNAKTRWCDDIQVEITGEGIISVKKLPNKESKSCTE